MLSLVLYVLDRSPFE